MKIDFKIQFNIQNPNVILGDIQAENVQTGDYASIHKQPEKNKGKVKAIVTIVSFLAALFTCLGYLFGWLGPIKEFIAKILWPK